MKKFLILFILTTQFSFGQTSFEKANNLYQKGKYDQAIIEYNRILASQKHSAELYFNLGNCYYKLNKVAPAIYNYEKALVLNPDDFETINNLKFAQKLQIDEIKVIPQVGFSKIIRDFTSIFHYNTWAWISVGFGFLFLICFCGYYFSGFTSTKRLYFFGMFALLLLISIGILSAIAEKNHFQNEKPAIIFSELTLLKSEPQISSNTIFTLHEGTKVFIKETLASWNKVQLTDGSEGWIEKKTIREVKEF